jgi:hypothetical protein
VIQSDVATATVPIGELGKELLYAPFPVRL